MIGKQVKFEIQMNESHTWHAVWDQIRLRVAASAARRTRIPVGTQVQAEVRDRVWDGVWDGVLE